MHKVTRTRLDPRRELTRQALVEAAEALFGQDGIESVTVRQIAAAVGSANKNVVSYHFGGKDALIDAVFRWRLPELDRARGAMLDSLAQQGRADDPRALLEVLWRPTFDLVDRRGKRGFAMFLRAVLHDRYGHLRQSIRELTPHTERTSGLLLAISSGHCGATAARRRIDLVSTMMLEAISMADGAGAAEAETAFADALTAAAAALLAPGRPAE